MNDVQVELLVSAYLDGELTQQEAQKVRLMLSRDPQYQSILEQYQKLRRATNDLKPFDEPTTAQWESQWEAISSRLSRRSGFALFTAGATVVALYLLVSFVVSPEFGTVLKLGVVSLLFGVLFLFYSVLQERIVDARTDKYKGVKR